MENSLDTLKIYACSSDGDPHIGEKIYTSTLIWCYETLAYWVTDKNNYIQLHSVSSVWEPPVYEDILKHKSNAAVV